ncbi:YihY/virulence factor BrkB family protein [Sphingomonas aerophila]|uniref:Membrane protein n=1 Tax=Sphingomonas aerophila TaxID=1344948 RepID=A0A7W9B9S5_9SPHN|nr:YihY/virulence factor BrkB family protein [Sphingomonas aerophila]MBB5713251.1 membrane protein [Sphingomonas aerophila]
MSQGLELTPEARAHHPGRARARVTKEFARVKPGSVAFEVTKRAALGVYNDGFIHAGNLAYLALMTLFPFFIVAAAILSLLGQSAETQHTVASFLHVLPPDVADLLRKPIADVLTARTGPLLWLGGLVGLWTVGSFVDTIRDIFRRAYGTKSSASFFKARLRLSGAIVGSVILVLLSFFVQGLLTAAEQFVYRLLPFAQEAATWIGLSRLVPGVVMFGALYVLFYSVTPSKYRHSDSRKWPGALFVAVWWIGITALLPKVLASLGGYDMTYGSLAGVVVMLLFFYTIGLGFVFGAHLNAALAEPDQLGLQGGPTDRELEAASA